MFTIYADHRIKQSIAREAADACISRGYYITGSACGLFYTAANAGDAVEFTLTLEAAARYYQMRKNSTHHAAAELLHRDAVAALEAAGIDAPCLPRLGAVIAAR